MEKTRKRVKPGYKPGAVVRELASSLSFRLWEMLRDRASPEALEILDLHDSMEVIALGLDEGDSLADPLGNIVEVLEFLDGVRSPDCANANPC